MVASRFRLPRHRMLFRCPVHRQTRSIRRKRSMLHCKLGEDRRSMRAGLCCLTSRSIRTTRRRRLTRRPLGASQLDPSGMLRLMISFIVPAYNEERLLGATLDALHAAGRAAGEPYELVVVDDASTDRTALIALGHAALLVRVAHRQIAATRNAGARRANGDLFIFVDADTTVNEAVVRSAVEAVRGC